MILTYQQQLNLVDQGLAKASVNGKFTTFKYAKKVMYDYLWDKHPELKYCRGQTYDNTNGNLVTLPPTKTFNYLENGTWKDVALDTQVVLYKKINGFLAVLSIYQGEIIVSTTGTTKSDYAKLATEIILERFDKDKILEVGSDSSWLFEICHPSDPHIVNEEYGAHYLGRMFHSDGSFTPGSYPVFTDLENALKLVKIGRGEGFMMYNANGNCCKLKTDYYVGKKKLMRMNKGNVNRMYKNGFEIANKLPEMWYDMPRKIVSAFGQESWNAMTDQQRRAYIEDVEKEIGL